MMPEVARIEPHYPCNYFGQNLSIRRKTQKRQCGSFMSTAGFFISCQQLYPLLQLHKHFDLFASSSSSSSGLGFWVQDDSLSWPFSLSCLHFA
jgi:hypothetical protein